MEIKYPPHLSSMERSSRQQEHRKPLSNYDFSDFADRLRFLLQQLAMPHRESQEQSVAYLQAGCAMFNMDYGYIAINLGSILPRIVAFEASSGEVRNTLSPLEETCYHAIVDRSHETNPSTLQEASVHSPSMTYNGAVVCQYLGAPLVISGNTCGVLCFGTGLPAHLASQPTPHDLETLELMAQGVARMIELQNTQEKNRIEEIRGFATAGVKSLDEYKSMARLPEVYGASGRVVEVLQRRIGKSPLSIDHIAQELNLSKRTLQRRLQQQNISFAQLRDQVRFHYSIDYLIHETLSIDAISTALDFSDRTSFTNAFKRWTNLSPSTFRKLFRDYI